MNDQTKRPGRSRPDSFDPMRQKELLPFIPRMVNLVGRPLTRLGFGNLILDSIEKKAKNKVGWSDFGGDLYRKGAAVFLDSIQSNSGLHFVGRQIIHETVEQRLRSRLNVNRLLNTNERIREYFQNGPLQNDGPPVFVIGTPRSGTTLLYNLLALDASARAPRFWEVLDPAPPASVLSQAELKRRIRYHDHRLSRFRKLFPSSFQRVHAVSSALEFEEDFYLLETSFRCPSLAFVYGPADQYRDYLFGLPDEVVVDAYREFARAIRLLMYRRDPESPSYWIGKSPAHAPFSWAIPRVFPNSIIIHTHRDPSERIPSLCSLFATAELLICSPSDKYEIAERVLDYNQLSMDGIKRGRLEVETSHSIIIDVDYLLLKSQPMETVASIYDQIGRDLSPRFESAAMNWLENQNAWDPKKRGEHRYRAEDFGLSTRMLKNMES